MTEKRQKPLDDRRIYYVYQHINTDPSRGPTGCRYIGKGKQTRAWNVGPKDRNYLWRNVFENNPPEVMLFAENMTEEEAFELEKEMIWRALSAGVQLCNLTEGGEGMSGWKMPEEMKIKIGNTHRNKKKTKEHREKISKTLMGRKNGPPSEITKQKISETKRGTVFTEEHKRRLSEAAKRRIRKPTGPLSEEHKMKISKTLAGRKLTEQHRKNISTAQTGKKHQHTGGRRKSEKKRKWMTKNKTCRQVAFDELEKYLKDGWKLGRIFKSDHNRMFRKVLESTK